MRKEACRTQSTSLFIRARRHDDPHNDATNRETTAPHTRTGLKSIRVEVLNSYTGELGRK